VEACALQTPDLSVVIHPRERLGGLEECVRSLAEATDADTEFIIVDQGYAKRDLARARAIVAPRPLTIVHDGSFLPEGAARNLGLEASRSPAWVLLVDGEMTVAPDAVQWMRRAADETGAAVVQPLLLERVGVIHTTGGRFVYPDSPEGPLDHVEGHYQEYCAARHNLQRTELEMLETHILLVDRHATGKAPFEEQNIHLFHFDFSLTCLRNDWKVVMEPRARAMFHRPPPISWSDLKFYNRRWSRERFDADTRLFEQKWGWTCRTENLDEWEEFALNMSLFPKPLRNRFTQPISNALFRTRQRAGLVRREWRLRQHGGPLGIA
jgi:hypothetical protein